MSKHRRKSRKKTHGVMTPKNAVALNRSPYQSADIAAGFPPTAAEDLVFHGGKTIAALVYTNLYLGGAAAWPGSDQANIDRALEAAMNDAGLNNVMQQYFPAQPITAAFRVSPALTAAIKPQMSRADLETLIKKLHKSGTFSAFVLSSTAFNFILPKGIVLTTDFVKTSAKTHRTRRPKKPKHPKLADSADSSLDGLAGYHGSVKFTKPAKAKVYYTICAYSEGTNGVVAFDQPWKNIVATLYHELQEVRTDPDVEEAIKAGATTRALKLLGWVSASGNEVGDLPMSEAGHDLGKAMVEVPLAGGGGTVPVQLMYSNRVHGPEGPVVPVVAKAA